MRPVQIDPSHVQRTIVGLRPFRPQGFRVDAEKFGELLVVHNYGHGGCGVTLSWGTAERAARLACMVSPRRAAVLGAGAVGLATARLLQERGVAVTVYARDFPPNTTSDVAGALWSPVTLVDEAQAPAGFKYELEEAVRIAHKHFMRLSHRSCGVRWLDFYLLTDTEAPHESWEWSATPDLFRPTTLGPDEHPFPGGFAHRYRLMMIDPAVYLPTLVAEVRAAGGQLETRTVSHLAELPTLGADVVVNCTGLGSRDLFGDESLTPIKGQLALLPPQPDIDYAVKSMTEDLYMFPRTGGIVLGGSHERGEWSLNANPEHSARILARHAHLFDRMRPERSRPTT